MNFWTPRVESRAKYLELMGRTFGIWDDGSEWPPKWLVQAETEARAQLALAGAGEETTPYEFHGLGYCAVRISDDAALYSADHVLKGGHGIIWSHNRCTAVGTRRD